MSDMPAVVYVVDDDPSVLRALSRLLRQTGLDARPYASPRAFLDQHDPGPPGCAILDLSMPDLDGLELQRELSACGRPIIFITGHGDVLSSVRAMKAGAVDFLIKPVPKSDLMRAVDKAIRMDLEARTQRAECDLLHQRLTKLTPREQQVFELVATGRLNKQIAAELGTAEKTVKVHRARVMEKLGVRSVVDLARMADRGTMCAVAHRGAMVSPLAAMRLWLQGMGRSKEGTTYPGVGP